MINKLNNSNNPNDDYQYIDYHQRSINTTINLSELDSPRNIEYKSFFFFNLTAKEQEKLLGLNFNSFMKELDKLYRTYQKNRVRKQKSGESLLSRIKKLFK